MAQKQVNKSKSCSVLSPIKVINENGKLYLINEQAEDIILIDTSKGGKICNYILQQNLILLAAS